MRLALSLDKQDFGHKTAGLHQVTQVAFGRTEAPLSPRIHMEDHRDLLLL